LYIDLTLPLSGDDLFLKEYKVARSGHLGTHIDVDPSVSIPPERFISSGPLINLSSVADRLIEPSDLEQSQDGLDVYPGDFLLIHTGWLARKYGQPEYFDQHPHLSDDAVDWIISKKPNMVGIDTPGLARRDRHSDVDRHLATHDIFVVENIANLEQLRSAQFILFCFPLNVRGTSGLPVRLVARMPH